MKIKFKKDVECGAAQNGVWKKGKIYDVVNRTAIPLIQGGAAIPAKGQKEEKADIPSKDDEKSVK